MTNTSSVHQRDHSLLYEASVLCRRELVASSSIITAISNGCLAMDSSCPLPLAEPASSPTTKCLAPGRRKIKSWALPFGRATHVLIRGIHRCRADVSISVSGEQVHILQAPRRETAQIGLLDLLKLMPS